MIWLDSTAFHLPPSVKRSLLAINFILFANISKADDVRPSFHNSGDTSIEAKSLPERWSPAAGIAWTSGQFFASTAIKPWSLLTFLVILAGIEHLSIGTGIAVSESPVTVVSLHERRVLFCRRRTGDGWPAGLF